MKKLLLLFLCCMIPRGFSQEAAVQDQPPALSNLSLHAYVRGMLPTSSYAEFLNLGGSLGFSLDYRFPRARWLYTDVSLLYQLQSVDLLDPLSLIAGSFGFGLAFGANANAAFLIGIDVGMWTGFANSSAMPFPLEGSGLFANIHTGVSFLVSPSLSIGADLSYMSFSEDAGISFAIQTGYHFGARAGSASPAAPKVSPKPEALPDTPTATPAAEQPATTEPKQVEAPKTEPPKTEQPPTVKPVGVTMVSASFENLFPVFHSYYDTHPVGTISIKNTETVPVSNVTVSFQIKQYMGTAKECATIAQLKAGETRDVPLFALFNNDILGVTEGTRALGEITIAYTLNDRRDTVVKTDTVRILGRNSMTWDDDRRAAAFVTARDATVQTFAKNVSSIVKDEGNSAINPWLSVALGLHQALDRYGLRYSVDPKSSYSDFSKEKRAIDFLQFPRETLEFKGGDCDDLSILFCALMEAVGTETAYITVPGHIFMAFSVDLKPDEGRKAFSRADDLIFFGDKTWIPVEVTDRKGGFLAAWQAGAKEWRENLARNQAAFLPVHDAWKIFEPVGLPGEGRPVTPPAEQVIKAAYTQEMVQFVNREILPNVASLQAEMKKRGELPLLLNQLGVLYARYGLLDQASAQMTKAVAKEEYAPALMNLGNISSLKGDPEGALAYYERAQKKLPDNPKAVLALARINHEMQNYGVVAKLYARLKTLDAALAAQFSYLDLKGEEASRAAELSNLKGVMIWEE